MRAVVQRVSKARVIVDGAVAGEIQRGLAALVGVGVDDSVADAEQLAGKIAHLRIFSDDEGLMNLDVTQIRGRILLISQFTLHGDARKGRRPSFVAAAPEELALPLYRRVGEVLESLGVPVAPGVFGAHMDLDLTNDGPVTILLDTKKRF